MSLNVKGEGQSITNALNEKTSPAYGFPTDVPCFLAWIMLVAFELLPPRNCWSPLSVGDRHARGMVRRIRLRGRNRGGMKKDLNLFLLSSRIDLELRFFHSRQFEYWIAKMTISASKCCTFHYDRTCQFDEGKNLIQFCWLPTTRTRVSVHTNQFRTQEKILQARQVERPLLGRFLA